MTSDEKTAAESHVGNVAAAFKIALAQREFEIAQLTNRNNFFMVFQGVLLAGLVQSQGSAPAALNFLVCLAGMAMSLFQAGMAGGAKYWQTRWEVAVKYFELRLISEIPLNKTLLQLFTADQAHLSENEIFQIRTINAFREYNGLILLSHKENFIQSLVEEDLKRGRGLMARINPSVLVTKRRFSVSRIPFWVGSTLLIIWTALWLNTFAFQGQSAWAWTIGKITTDAITLVPFKPEEKK